MTCEVIVLRLEDQKVPLLPKPANLGRVNMFGRVAKVVRNGWDSDVMRKHPQVEKIAEAILVDLGG